MAFPKRVTGRTTTERTIPNGVDTIARQRMEENAVKASFVAGFGPILAYPVGSRTFWGDDLTPRMHAS